MNNQTPPATDRAALRDRIRRVLCERDGQGALWGTDMLEPDEYGQVADAVLAVLPAPADRAAEIERLREKYLAGLNHADEVNNALMEEVQRYADGKERPVLWSVYNAMHKRAITAEATVARVRRLHDALDEETALTSPNDEITRGAAARKIAAALDGWTDPAELRRMADEAQPNVEPSEADALWDELHRRDIETDKPHAVEAQPDDQATAAHHTVDGTRYLCHTDDHYCPKTQPTQTQTGDAISTAPQSATQAADESPHVYMVCIRHQAGWAHDFLKAGRVEEALEQVEAIERLAAVTRRAVAGKAEGGGE
jgi:hypothetical protein